MTENQHPSSKPSQPDPSSQRDTPVGESHSTESWNSASNDTSAPETRRYLEEAMAAQGQLQFEAVVPAGTTDGSEPVPPSEEITGVLDASALEQVLYGPDSEDIKAGFAPLPSFDRESAPPFDRESAPPFDRESAPPLDESGSSFAPEPLPSFDRESTPLIEEEEVATLTEADAAPDEEPPDTCYQEPLAVPEGEAYAAPSDQRPVTTAQAPEAGAAPAPSTAAARQVPVTAAPQTPIATAEAPAAIQTHAPKAAPLSSLAPSATSLTPGARKQQPVRPGQSQLRSVGTGVVIGILLALGIWQYPRLQQMLGGPSDSLSELPPNGPTEQRPAVAPAAPPPLAAAALPTQSKTPQPNASEVPSTPTASNEKGRSIESLAPEKPTTRISARRNAKDAKEAKDLSAGSTDTSDTTERSAHGPSVFNERAATNAIAYASRSLTACHDPEIGRISTRADVTFAPSGRVTQVTLQPTLAMRGSPMIGCVVQHLREAVVPQFDGERVTVHAVVTVD